MEDWPPPGEDPFDFDTGERPGRLRRRPRDGSRMASELEQDGKITWKGHGAMGTLRAGDELFALVEDEKMGDPSLSSVAMPDIRDFRHQSDKGVKPVPTGLLF